MIYKRFICFFIFVGACHFAMADEYTELITYRDSLKKQIESIDSEIVRCEKSLKGWKAATIIGSIGTVASGIGAVVQNQQIKENKKNLNDMSVDSKESTEILNFMERIEK